MPYGNSGTPVVGGNVRRLKLRLPHVELLVFQATLTDAVPEVVAVFVFVILKKKVWLWVPPLIPVNGPAVPLEENPADGVTVTVIGQSPDEKLTYVTVIFTTADPPATMLIGTDGATTQLET
jgi:hypothetical protein